MLELKGPNCGDVLHGNSFLNADICSGLAIFGMSARNKWSWIHLIVVDRLDSFNWNGWIVMVKHARPAEGRRKLK